MVFFYAPTEAIMGAVQRVFYFHVAAGWVGMLGFLVAAVSGVAYLRTGNRKWDTAGFASVEIGPGFHFHYGCFLVRSGRAPFGTPGGPGSALDYRYYHDVDLRCLPDVALRYRRS